MKPLAPRPPAPPEPHPTCLVCTDAQPCAFHTATTLEGFARILSDAVHRRGAGGFYDSVLASLATLTDWENNPLGPDLARCDFKPIQKRLQRLLDKEESGWTTDEMTHIAACFLSLTILSEAKDQHAPQSPR